MTNTLQVPLHKPLRALRVHRVPESEDAPDADPHAVWLLRLREIAVQEARSRAELMACVDVLRDAAAGIPELVRSNLAEVTALATEIGLCVAREVVGNAIDRGLVDPSPTVRRCLEEATVGLADPELEVRLHPEDLSLVMSELEGQPELRKSIESARFTPDATMNRAAVSIQTRSGRLHYDHRDVLERMSDELRKAVSTPAVESVITQDGA